MLKLFEKSTFITAVVLGLIFLIPLIILELVNRWRFEEDFPFAIFTFTGALQTIFLWLLLLIIKDGGLGKSLTKKPIILLLRTVGLVLIAYIWGGWIIDQWPCLMGVPNCD